MLELLQHPVNLEAIIVRKLGLYNKASNAVSKDPGHAACPIGLRDDASVPHCAELSSAHSLIFAMYALKQKLKHL